MKRKFSFNLAPIKTSAQQEGHEKSTQGPTSSHGQPSAHSHAHRRSVSIESAHNYDSSPWCCRRALDAQTERELRVACRLILKNFKPSDYGMENTDPKLDFGGIQQWKEFEKAKPKPAGEVKVRMPTGAPAGLTGSHVARKSSKGTRTRTKADNEIRARQNANAPVQANTSQKRADFGWLDDRDDKREQNLRKAGRGASIDMPRSATFKKGDSGVSTPVTVTSTLAYKKSSSTGPASATLPGAHSSRRPSQPENVVVIEALNNKGRPSNAAIVPSRSNSIKKGLKNYVFSGTRSRTLSRKPSQDSIRTTGSLTSQNSSQDLQRSGSISGWRNWVRPRSRSTSRPGTANGQADDADTKKADHSVVDLNRELPPLPGLDTWKEPPPAKEETAKSPISPVSGPHIATLMRPKESQPARHTSPRVQHGKSESEAPIVQHKHTYPERKSSRRDPPSFSFPDAKRTNPYSPIVIGPLSTGSSSTSNLDRIGSSIHTRQRSGGSLTSPSSPMGEMNLDGTVNTYSRKMSTEVASRGPVFNNEVNILKKDEQKSKIKKVFSGWMHKKTKKDDWMQKIEKGGVKEGVVVQETNNTSAVVRY